MKDIDFDELDRAVNSLMDPKTKDTLKLEARNEPTETAEVFTQTDDDELDATTGTYESEVTSEPELESPPVVEKEEPEERLAIEPISFRSPTVTHLPAASRGRFMDVMRPATRAVARPLQSTAVSRQGNTLQPGTMRRPPIAGPSDAIDQPNELTESKTDLDEVVENFQSTSTDTTDRVEPDTAQGLNELSFEAAEDTAFLSSPFLPDAKVEKRPLGRPAEAASSDGAHEQSAKVDDTSGEPLATADSSVSPYTDAQLPEQPLPAELGSELLSIESGGDSSSTLSQPVAATETITPRSTAVSETGAPSLETLRNITSASIPQQYKVQSESKDKAPTVGGIYDTQPLAHPAEKKPGWLWVVAIIAILLIGAGGGAAVYYFGLL